MSNNNSIISIENIKFFLAVGYPLAVFIGFYNLQSYFSNFGISIYNYVDLTELLLVFLNDLTYLLLYISAFFIGVIYTLVFNSNNSKIEVEDKKDINNIAEISSKGSTFIKKFKKTIEVFFEYLPIFFPLFILLFYPRNSQFVIVELAYIGFYFSIVNRISKINRSSIMIFGLQGLILLMLILVFISDKNNFKSDQIINCVSIDNNKIIYNNFPIESDSTSMFIGETKNYFFFYNCLSKSTKVQVKSKIE